MGLENKIDQQMGTLFPADKETGLNVSNERYGQL